MPSSGVQTCARSEEHTSELQSHSHLVCRLLLEKKNVPGGKHAVLKLMGATILADGEYELTNVPAIVDVLSLGELLEAIAIRVSAPVDGRLRLRNDGNLT